MSAEEYIVSRSKKWLSPSAERVLTWLLCFAVAVILMFLVHYATEAATWIRLTVIGIAFMIMLFGLAVVYRWI